MLPSRHAKETPPPKPKSNGTKPTNKMPSSGKRPTARATDLIRPQRRVRDVLAVEQVVDERGAVGGKMLLGQIGDGAMAKGTPGRDRRRDGDARKKGKREAKTGEDGHFYFPTPFFFFFLANPFFFLLSKPPPKKIQKIKFSQFPKKLMLFKNLQHFFSFQVSEREGAGCPVLNNPSSPPPLKYSIHLLISIWDIIPCFVGRARGVELAPRNHKARARELDRPCDWTTDPPSTTPPTLVHLG